MQLQVGQIVEGKVSGITKFGAFVNLGEGVTGLVHISEVSSTYVENIEEHLKLNQVVKVKVLNIGDDKKISLSIKKALPQSESNENRRPKAPFQGNKRDMQQRPQNNNNGNTAGSQRQAAGQRSGGFKPVNANNRPKVNETASFNPNAATTPKGSPAFEDMLSKFMSTSEDKISGLKQQERRTRRGGKKGNDNY